VLRHRRIYHWAADALALAGAILRGADRQRAARRAGCGVDWAAGAALEGSLFRDRDIGRGRGATPDRRRLGRLDDWLDRTRPAAEPKRLVLLLYRPGAGDAWCAGHLAAGALEDRLWLGSDSRGRRRRAHARHQYNALQSAGIRNLGHLRSAGG